MLDALHRDPHGVQVLAEALAAGRRGEPARAVREDGEVIEQVAGDVQPMNNQWVRRTFDDAPVRDTATKPSVATAAMTPRERVAVHIRAMDSLAADLERQLEAAAKIATGATARSSSAPAGAMARQSRWQSSSARWPTS